METFDAIITRRSIRKFKPTQISRDSINTILKAGMYAPTAYNQQPWQFIVIDERKLLETISEKHPHASMCKTAPVAILVCADLSFEQSKDLWVFDCAAATQNILLASHDLGIGSVWVGVYFRKEYEEIFTKLFKLPKNIIPISLIPLGYPAEEKPKIERFKKERVHFNSW
jgi:nitroreductase